MVSKQTVTLANSIVGVSVLAMPFCFKQCGIILATLMLIVGAVITRMVCYFLLKAGTITRRRNYEMLAWHTFGQGGKFIVEISIIGFLIGTLIAFFVVMGDLGPEIVSEVFTIENNDSLRTIIMSALSLFVALPLCLLRNLDSLSSVSTASVLFYVFLVFKILSEGLGPLFSGAYLDRVDYWRPAGVLQCIPILSMALSCQTQIFGIYESLPDPSLQRMNEIVKQAVNVCTLFYFSVGFFGYIAFSHQSFGGNILMTFSPGITTQLIKLCFLLSIVFSVPLVVFPCRQSLHSLIFRRVQMHHSLHDISTNYISDGKLKLLTTFIIGFTLVVGILIPNIEIVLGLVGSTTGTVICLIFPSIMFIQVTSKQTTERLLAKIILFTGIVTMVVSTYATLYAAEQASQLNDPLPDQLRATEIIKEIRKEEMKASFQTPEPKIVDVSPAFKNKLDDFKKLKKEQDKPIFLSSSPKPMKPLLQNKVNVIEVENKNQVKMKDGPVDDKKKKPPDFDKKPKNSPNQEKQPKLIEQPMYGGGEVADKIVPKSKPVDTHTKEETPNKEPAEESQILEKDAAVNILKKLEEHQENQKKLLEEQRQILEELKEHHEQDVQRQKETEVKEKAPLIKADELINAVAHEEMKVEPGGGKNKDSEIEKVEVLQQEKLIEKFSENIEKEKENVKIIDKIEEGLNKEIVKIEGDSKPKLPELVPIQADNNHQQPPIAVDETIGKMSKKIDPQKNINQRPDPIMQVVEYNPSNSDINSNVVKPVETISEQKQVQPNPIPLQPLKNVFINNELKTKDQPVVADNLKSTILVGGSEPKTLDNLEIQAEPIKKEVENVQLVAEKSELNKKLQVVPEPEESAKKIDRDI